MSRDPFVSAEDIDGIAAWSVIRAARVLARQLADRLSPSGLTPVEFGVLLQVAASRGLTKADLARAVGSRPQSVAGVVATLTARGLLDHGGQQGRGHRSQLVLTLTGRSLLDEAYPIVQSSNSWFGEGGAAALVTILRPTLNTPTAAAAGTARGSDSPDDSP